MIKYISFFIILIALLVIIIILLLSNNFKPFSIVTKEINDYECKDYYLGLVPEVTDSCKNMYLLNGLPVSPNPTDCKNIVDPSLCQIKTDVCKGFIPVAKLGDVPYYYYSNDLNFCDNN